MHGIEIVYPSRIRKPSPPKRPGMPPRVSYAPPDVTGYTEMRPIGEDGILYMLPKVLEEAARLHYSGLWLPELHHTTSSLDLPSIAEHGTVLSHRKLMELGGRAMTGKTVSEKGSCHIQGGLEDVYASRGGPCATEYTKVKNAGKNVGFPVAFGIPEGKLKIPFYNQFDHGDGVRLGSIVRLGIVAVIATESSHVNDLSVWSRENMPNKTPVISFGAARVLFFPDRKRLEDALSRAA